MQDLIGKNSSRLVLSMRLMDVLLLQTAGNLSGQFHFNTPLDQAAPIHLVLLYFCSALAFLLFDQFSLYSSWRGRSAPIMIGRLAAVLSFVFLIGLFFSFLIHHVGYLSRLWMFYWFVTGIIFLALFRWAVYSTLQYLRKNGLNAKHVIIVGYGRTGQEMHNRALLQDWYGYEVKAIQSDDLSTPILRDPNVEKIGTIEDIPDYIPSNNIDEVWIALPMSASDQLYKLQYLLRNALVDIRWIPDTLCMQMLSHKVGDFLGFPAVDLNRPVSTGFSGFAKDLFDKVFSLVVLLMLLPVFSVI